MLLLGPGKKRISPKNRISQILVTVLKNRNNEIRSN